jgi:hypothetical protein
LPVDLFNFSHLGGPRQSCDQSCDEMVGVGRFELPTPCSRTIVFGSRIFRPIKYLPCLPRTRRGSSRGGLCSFECRRYLVVADVDVAKRAFDAAVIECPLRDLDVATRALHPRSEIVAQIMEPKIRDARASERPSPLDL